MSTHQIFLIHGNNEADVSDARFELVKSLLTPEERDAGLTEIRGPGNSPLTLDRALSEIIGELGTASFLPGSRRVVVVHDLAELMEKSRKKPAAAAKPKAESKAKKPAARDRVEIFVDWLADVLPTTENIVIFVCVESDEKGKAVSEDNDLYRLIRDRGRIIMKRDKPLNYEFENHILTGNVVPAVTTLRDWIDRAGNDSGSRLRIYSTVTTLIELVFQAVCQAEAKRAGIPANQAIVAHGYPTLEKIPEFKKKKIEAIAARVSPAMARELLADSAALQRVLYPTGEEDYIPPWDELLEDLTIRLCGVRR